MMSRIPESFFSETISSRSTVSTSGRSKDLSEKGSGDVGAEWPVQEELKTLNNDKLDNESLYFCSNERLGNECFFFLLTSQIWMFRYLQCYSVLSSLAVSNSSRVSAREVFSGKKLLHIF